MGDIPLPQYRYPSASGPSAANISASRHVWVIVEAHGLLLGHAAVILAVWLFIDSA
jgi:hypothetical protein